MHQATFGSEITRKMQAKGVNHIYWQTFSD